MSKKEKTINYYTADQLEKRLNLKKSEILNSN